MAIKLEGVGEGLNGLAISGGTFFAATLTQPYGASNLRSKISETQKKKISIIQNKALNRESPGF